MKRRNIRVFIGPNEVANIGAILAKALRDQGQKVTVVSIGFRPLQAGMDYDMVLAFKGLNKFKKITRYLYYSAKFFFQHDVFIFLFGKTLLPYNLDLPFYRLFRKKTAMWFLGSDIRDYKSLEVAARKANVKHFISKDKGAGPEVLKRKLRMLRMVEKHVDNIISYPSISQLLRRGYTTIHIPIDIDSIKYSNLPNPIAVVAHAPTNSEFKGTPYIIEAVERLKKEGYSFEFRLFENKSNIELRKSLTQTDIVVDQLYADVNGMFATEAMAAGCAVLGGNLPEFSGYPKELPVIHTDPDNIYENLKMLLENPELRRDLGEKGRRYVEKYHDSKKIAADILGLLGGNTLGPVHTK